MIEKIYSYLLRNQVVLTVFLVLFGWFLYETRGIWASVFLSYIIMAALLPFVHFLRRHHFPKILSVLIPFFGALFAVIVLIVPLVPFFMAQTQTLFENLPGYLRETTQILGLQVNSSDVQAYLTSELGNLGENAVSLTGKVFGGVFSLFTILIVSFYLLFYREQLQEWVKSLFPEKLHQRVEKTIEQVDDKLGAWMRGQAILSLVIGVLTWVVLSLLGMEYALPLALLAGMLEVLPTIGPIIAAIPAIIIALTVSPPLALAVTIAYICIQLLENHFLVPNIMQRAVGMNPILVIIGITVGGSLMGIAGALLSIPFISFLIVLFNNMNKGE